MAGSAYLANRVRPSQVGKARTSAGGPSNRMSPLPTASVNGVRPSKHATQSPLVGRHDKFGVAARIEVAEFRLLTAEE